MGVQVRTATSSLSHNEAGSPIWTSRPVMEKQFISFSWGGKNIEDFDLIVANGDGMMNKSLYADFEDTTTNYTYIDGQSYWGTTMQANKLDFTLATDGMDSKSLEEFKAYFKPGETRKLILTEFPFRYAYARIGETPSMEMLPFEKKITNDLGTFRTTEYKGSIRLNFVLDDPYWYNTDESAYFTGELSEEQKKDKYETGTAIIKKYSGNHLTRDEVKIVNMEILSVEPKKITVNPFLSRTSVSSLYIKIGNTTDFVQDNGYMVKYNLKATFSTDSEIIVKHYNSGTLDRDWIQEEEGIAFNIDKGEATFSNLSEALATMAEKFPDDMDDVYIGEINARAYAYATTTADKVTNACGAGYTKSDGGFSAGVMINPSLPITIDNTEIDLIKSGRVNAIYVKVNEVNVNANPETYSNMSVRVSINFSGTHKYRIYFTKMIVTLEEDGIRLSKTSNFPEDEYSNEDCTGWYPNSDYITANNVGANNINKNYISKTNIDTIHYCGTALGLPIVKLKYDIDLATGTNTVPYVNSLYSSYAPDENGIKVNAVSIGDNIMHFTLPPLLSSYNQALKIVEEAKDNESLIEVKARLREQMSSAMARKWAIKTLNDVTNSAAALTNAHRLAYYNKMKILFHTNCNVIFIFNSITGEITAQYSAILIDDANQTYAQVTESAGSCLKSALLTIPAKDSENNGVLTIKAPNATELSVDYKYRFY